MTISPSPVVEPDAESEDEQELSRVTVLVGELLVDVGVPDGASISAVVDDVIGLANGQLAQNGGSEFRFDNSEGQWTFARLAGDALEPNRSLNEVGIYDGEILVIREAEAPATSPLVDDLQSATEPSVAYRRWFAEQRWMAGWFGCGTAVCAATALLVPGGDVTIERVPLAAMVVTLAGIGCAITAFTIALRSGAVHRPTWLAAMAMLLILGGSAHLVPHARGVDALPMALALTAVFALAQLLGSARARSLYTAVITLAVLGVPAALAQMLLSPNPRTVGALLATMAVIIVYLAPRITILLSRLPVPRVPTAGEPLDDIETQGGTAVEGVNALGKQVVPTEQGMAEQVRRARDHLTGLVAAAAIVANIGCYFAVDVSNGFFWQGTVFGMSVATLLCLRGRGHHDLVQSAALIAGGMMIALVVIVKVGTFVDGCQVAAAAALLALIVLLVVCGLIAPRQEFSPVMRRWVETVESLATLLVLPLACSIIRLYAVFRELRI